jgi:hypothetical protein
MLKSHKKQKNKKTKKTKKGALSAPPRGGPGLLCKVTELMKLLAYPRQ